MLSSFLEKKVLGNLFSLQLLSLFCKQDERSFGIWDVMLLVELLFSFYTTWLFSVLLFLERQSS